MQPTFKYFDIATWANSAAALVMRVVQRSLVTQGSCDVMLTGGRSAEHLYEVWATLPDFEKLRGVRFYFGDERCVAPEALESNYGMVMRTLFRGGVPAGCALFRIEADKFDREAAAEQYARILPTKIDLMLLGVGEDGHIASLFPGSKLIYETGRLVACVTGPKPPCERITITPKVIAQAESIFVLAAGTEKAAVLSKALDVPSDVMALPARLVLNATWLLDSVLPIHGTTK